MEVVFSDGDGTPIFKLGSDTPSVSSDSAVTEVTSGGQETDAGSLVHRG